MDFALWRTIGNQTLIKSNINNWIVCMEGTGSIVRQKAGSLSCKLVKQVSQQCAGVVPTSFALRSYGPNVRVSFPKVPQASVSKWGQVRSHWYETDLMKYSHANKTHYHKRNFALSPVLKMRVFGTRKWPFTHLWSDFAPTEQPETPALWQSM